PAPVAIISIAQHASPNVTGHIDCLRAQLTARSSWVTSTPRLTSCSTSALSPLPAWTPAIRSTGMGHLGGGGTELRGTIPSRRSRGAQSMCSAPLRPPARGVPVQAPCLPDVHIGDEDEGDEHHHLDEAEQPEAAELHRPGEQEDRLDVEDDEQHRDDVELHGEALAAGVPLRDDPALVRRELRGRRLSRTQERRRT